MEQYLPIEIVEKIYKMKHLMEMQSLKHEINYHDIFMIKDYNRGYGLVFGGAKNVLIGEEKGYGIFISNTIIVNYTFFTIRIARFTNYRSKIH